MFVVAAWGESNYSLTVVVHVDTGGMKTLSFIECRLFIVYGDYLFIYYIFFLIFIYIFFPNFDPDSSFRAKNLTGTFFGMLKLASVNCLHCFPC